MHNPYNFSNLFKKHTKISKSTLSSNKIFPSPPKFEAFKFIYNIIRDGWHHPQ